MFNYCFDIGGTSTKYIFFKNNILLKNLSFVYKNSENNNLEDFQTPFINILVQISEVLNRETKEFNLSIVLSGIIDSKNKKVLTQSAIKNVDIDLVKYFKNQTACYGGLHLLNKEEK